MYRQGTGIRQASALCIQQQQCLPCVTTSAEAKVTFSRLLFMSMQSVKQNVSDEGLDGTVKDTQGNLQNTKNQQVEKEAT